jgi:hypothetical protein
LTGPRWRSERGPRSTSPPSDALPRRRSSDPCAAGVSRACRPQQATAGKTMTSTAGPSGAGVGLGPRLGLAWGAGRPRPRRTRADPMCARRPGSPWVRRLPGGGRRAAGAEGPQRRCAGGLDGERREAYTTSQLNNREVR